jgi:hypothetical protein
MAYYNSFNNQHIIHQHYSFFNELLLFNCDSFFILLQTPQKDKNKEHKAFELDRRFKPINYYDKT